MLRPGWGGRQRKAAQQHSRTQAVDQCSPAEATAPDQSPFVRLGEDVDAKPMVFLVGMKWVEVTQT